MGSMIPMCNPTNRGFFSLPHWIWTQDQWKLFFSVNSLDSMDFLMFVFWGEDSNIFKCWKKELWNSEIQSYKVTEMTYRTYRLMVCIYYLVTITRSRNNLEQKSGTNSPSAIKNLRRWSGSVICCYNLVKLHVGFTRKHPGFPSLILIHAQALGGEISILFTSLDITPSNGSKNDDLQGGPPLLINGVITSRNWPYKWATGVWTLLFGLIHPFITIYIYIVGAHLVEISTPDILFTIIPFCTLQDRCDNNKNPCVTARHLEKKKHHCKHPKFSHVQTWVPSPKSMENRNKRCRRLRLLGQFEPWQKTQKKTSAQHCVASDLFIKYHKLCSNAPLFWNS